VRYTKRKYALKVLKMRSLFDVPLLNKIRSTAVIAVVVIDDEKDALPLADALLQGGIDIMELTLRTDAALGSMKIILEKRPQMKVGIGTILTMEQVEVVAISGAAFGVAPGTNPKILEIAKHEALPFAPGIMTPSDIECGLEHNCHLFKFFPAQSSGGLAHLKNISAPYQHLGLEFIPLGGVNQDNLETYLSAPNVIAVGGSWLATRDLINAGEWDQITENAAKATESVKKIRG
jgi:2-dehydro-3-deoxyphosphogluconate aldolase / (4S)-4-hydroxy-2-oxoglutarate aldolase